MTLDEIQARHEKLDATYKAGCSCCKTPQAHNDRAKLIQALRAVEAVHVPWPRFSPDEDPRCAGCSADCQYCEGDHLYPCPTIIAIQQALDG